MSISFFFVKPFALLAIASLLCSSVGFAADPATATIKLSSPLEARFIADDFWTAGGAKAKHDELTAEEAAAVNRLCTTSRDLIVRLRAYKVAADLDGRARYAKDVAPQAASDATAGAFAYLEEHFNDAEVLKFDPTRGFTHLSVARKADEPGKIWVLIESVGPDRESSGLNLVWDVAAKQASVDRAWGADRSLAKR